MLILSRYEQQAVQIGDDITVTVTLIETNRGRRPVVKLGIEAPRSISISRKEVDRGTSHGGEQPEAARAGGSAGTGDRPRPAAHEGGESAPHVRRAVAGA